MFTAVWFCHDERPFSIRITESGHITTKFIWFQSQNLTVTILQNVDFLTKTVRILQFSHKEKFIKFLVSEVSVSLMNNIVVWWKVF